MSNEVVDAINDLTRVTIALNGNFASQAEAVRKLSELAIPSGRIAAILAMSQNDVASIISKAKKKPTGKAQKK
jgi:DNA-directed RNA polymerase specialized sigma24 family protein